MFKVLARDRGDHGDHRDDRRDDHRSFLHRVYHGGRDLFQQMQIFNVMSSF